MTTVNYIKYKKGYKYRLEESYEGQTPIKPKTDIKTEYSSLDTDGVLRLNSWYAWDGASGPTFDTNTCMHASARHDALCEMIRLGLLDRKYIPLVHEDLRDTLKRDGMTGIRVKLWFWTRRFMDPATRPSGNRPILQAP